MGNRVETSCVLYEDPANSIMMYFNSFINNKNTGNKNTIMETILKNIKDLRNEFSVTEYVVDGYSYIQNDNMGKVDNLEALRRHHQLLAESNNSKALSLTPDDNCSYYSSDVDNGRNQYEYSSNWLSKFNQRHRESQDSGHSSPEKQQKRLMIRSFLTPSSEPSCVIRLMYLIIGRCAGLLTELNNLYAKDVLKLGTRKKIV